MKYTTADMRPHLRTLLADASINELADRLGISQTTIKTIAGGKRYGKVHDGVSKAILNATSTLSVDETGDPVRSMIDGFRAGKRAAAKKRSEWSEREFAIALDITLSAPVAARLLGCSATTVRAERDEWLFE